MSTPDHDEPDVKELLPTPVHSGARGGGELRIGNPGNRGGRGRPHRRIIVRAGENLERELARLERMAAGVRDVTCPCGCGHTFAPPPTATMPTRERIAYARLCADIKASGKGDDEPPLQIMVLGASASEMNAHAGPPPPGVVWVDGTERRDTEPPARNPG